MGLFKNGERPTPGLACLLHRVAVSLLAISLHRAAVKQVTVDHAFGAIKFDAVVHAALLGPAIFDHGDAAPFELDDDDGIVFTFGAFGVEDPLAVRHDALGLWLAVHPAGPLDAVAAHIHERAAARALDVIEPVRVRAGMLLALLHHVELPDSTLLHQLLGPHVFGRETDGLRVHEFYLVLPAGLDDGVRIFQGVGDRLLHGIHRRCDGHWRGISSG